MIDVYFISKSFGKKQVLNKVNFHIKQGEVYGLIGPNGAGKTTLIRILSTILKPNSGTATINNIDIIKDPLSIRKIVGILPEEVGLYDRLTPREILRYHGQLYDLDKEFIESQINTLFDKLELNEYADLRSSTLSKGTKQKVSIARTLIHDPLVLFLDEPTSGVDVLSAIGIKNIIFHRVMQNRTIILSTHNMTEVEKMCDRVGIINGGNIISEGTISELKNQTGEDELEDAFVRIIENNRSS